MSSMNTKRQADELSEQRKIFKRGLLNDFKESNLYNNSQEDYNHKDFLEISDESEVSSPEYVYESLIDEDRENCDHDSSLNENLENKKKPFEYEEEDFNEDNEEEVIENKTKQNYLEKDCDEENEAQTEGSSSQDSILSFQIQKSKKLETCLQSNKSGIIRKNIQENKKSCTSQIEPVGVSGIRVQQGNGHNKRPGVNTKFPELPVPAHINQYGDCLKTRLGRYHYGLTLNDPPCQFFQGVLKGASGQTLAAMFGDINLLSKFESLSSDEIGHFMIDTTFRVIPNSTEGINHVFTISLLHKHVVIPLWYAITSCSSPELYKRIIIEFQQHVLDWSFLSVVVNNDPALCKAVRAVFPDVNLYGSWFHYCYSIWKELSLHNVMEQCKEENSTLLTAAKLLMVVPYLPPSSTDSNPVTMVDGFHYVRGFARENNLPKEFHRVLDYVAVFWFKKVKPENFTLFEKHTCLTNHVEVLQLILLSYMKKNGNIWILTRSFQNIARSTYAEFLRLLNGKRLAAKNRAKKFNVPIRQNIKKLTAGCLDVRTYLENCTQFLEEILDIFLHPLYPTTTFEKTNYVHTEGWKVRIPSE